MPFTCDAVSGSDAIDCRCSGGPYLKLQSSSPVVVTSADTGRIAVQTATVTADDRSASLAGGDVICPSDSRLVAAAYDVMANARLEKSLATPCARSQQLEKLVTDKDRTISVLKRRLANVEERTKIVDELRQKNEKLEAEVRLLQHQNTELQQDLRSFVKEEEKANLEMAFLEEERDYAENKCRESRNEIFRMRNELEAVKLELERCKTINVLLKVKSSEKLECRLDEINELLREKRQFVQYIRDGLPTNELMRRMSLARTEELLAMRIQLNQTLQQLEYTSSTAASQELLIHHLTAVIQSTRKSYPSLSPHQRGNAFSGSKATDTAAD